MSLNIWGGPFAREAMVKQERTEQLLNLPVQRTREGFNADRELLLKSGELCVRSTWVCSKDRKIRSLRQAVLIL